MSPFCLISACLCGQACRYDGGSFHFPQFSRLVEKELALPVCPETLACLGVPREPCEILQGHVFTRSGHDVTAAFFQGASLVLAQARLHGIHTAVLKEKSPSCGVHTIYDGSFSGHLLPGQGMTTRLLLSHGFTVFSETTCPVDFGQEVK